MTSKGKRLKKTGTESEGTVPKERHPLGNVSPAKHKEKVVGDYTRDPPPGLT